MSNNIINFYGKCIVTDNNYNLGEGDIIINKHINNNHILRSDYNKIAFHSDIYPLFKQFYLSINPTIKNNKIFKYRTQNCIKVQIEVAIPLPYNYKYLEKYDGKVIIILLGSLYFITWHYLKFIEMHRKIQHISSDTYLNNHFSKIYSFTNEGVPKDKDGDIIMIDSL